MKLFINMREKHPKCFCEQVNKIESKADQFPVLLPPLFSFFGVSVLSQVSTGLICGLFFQ